MTREARRTLRISSLTVNDINFVLALLTDRLDELEGRRGTPTFKSNVNMDSNRITSVGDASNAADAISLGGAINAASSAATSAVSPISATISAAQNWITYQRIVDTNGTILHAFNATSV